MTRFKQIALVTVLLLGGCVYDSRDRVDQTVCTMSGHPYDQLPPSATMPPPATPQLPGPAAPNPPAGASGFVPPPAGTSGCAPPPQVADFRTVAWLEAAASPQASGGEPHLDLNIPPEIPGSEAPRIALPKEQADKQREIDRLYPPLPPLPAEPQPLPGPNGRPCTLADFQQIAAANSPALRQAASDVEAAKGALITADAYPNPTLSYNFTPSSNGSTPGDDGMGVAQTIRTGGKQALARAAAEMAVHNAELALKRARSDLSTSVRNAYFAVLVGKETVRVNRALAHFTDEVYRLQAQLLLAGQAAPYEPAGLRAQAFSARLAYRQSIQTYIYAWKHLVATINMRQLPLTDVGGRVDSFIPLYDYDALLAYVLRNHTDMLTVLNGVEIARYNLKAAQVTPIPDVVLGLTLTRDYSVEPKQTCPSVMLGVPLPIWDRNKGGVISAESALVRGRGTAPRGNGPHQHARRCLRQLQDEPRRAGVLSPLYPARRGALLSRDLRPPAHRHQRLVWRRGRRAADVCRQRGDLPDDAGKPVVERDRRGGPDPDRRPVPVRAAGGGAAAARRGPVAAAALLPPLRPAAGWHVGGCRPRRQYDSGARVRSKGEAMSRLNSSIRSAHTFGLALLLAALPLAARCKCR